MAKDFARNATSWQPLNDGVLIERLEPMLKPQNGIIVTANEGNGPILRKGVILACGPGKRDEDGERMPPDVKPGDLVLFNARWNDLRHGELRGTGSDLNGPLERPLSYRFDEKIHLVQEGDIAGILG